MSNLNSPVAPRAAVGRFDLGSIASMARNRSLEEMVPCTVDELIAKCEASMRTLDQQLRDSLNKQETRNGRLKTLSDLSKEITALGPMPSNPDAVSAWSTKRMALDAKVDQIAEDYPELADTMANVKEAIKGPGGTASKDANDVVSQEMDSIRSENETSMIEIQSIISKRSQALQMTSNMVNSFNETAKGLIQNLR